MLTLSPREAQWGEYFRRISSETHRLSLEDRRIELEDEEVKLGLILSTTESPKI